MYKEEADQTNSESISGFTTLELTHLLQLKANPIEKS